MANTLTAPAPIAVSTKYPHINEWSAAFDQDAQVRRIYAMAVELRRRDADAYAAVRDFVLAHKDDLYSIENTLRQALEALDAADDRMTETELRNA